MTTEPDGLVERLRKHVGFIERVYRGYIWTSMAIDLREAVDALSAAQRSHSVLLDALREADRWFDGWCPTATCCAGSGAEVHEQIRAALLSEGSSTASKT